jgi:aldehyde dehydrogenase (NAD+)
MNDIDSLFRLQKNNRWKFSQSPSQERKNLLKKLKSEVVLRREDIKAAIYKDFKKPFAESELTEIHTVLDEINFAVKNLKKWMKPVRVSSPITLLGSTSQIRYEAKGVVLILAPWNYPFSLLLNPLIASVAAGNCSICRPSEKTPHTGKILDEIVSAVFPAEIAKVVIGEIDLAEKLLELPFDHIFFTGSTAVGKKVMMAAAKNLATVTLELGGKSPVIIDRDVDLHSAVKKLTWGKFVNGGQTCVAPDYLFVPKELKDEFMRLFKEQVFKNYGETENDRIQSQDYARLIDRKSFDRLNNKITTENKIITDEALPDDNYLPPTIFEATLKSPIMDDEIFGPILPVITYDNLDAPIDYIQSTEKPLALYIFSNNKKNIQKILSTTTSGGAVVNNVLVHLANPYLPFGGAGHSGQGSYHGHFGFKAFSHEKSVLKQGKLSLIDFYFPPYSGTLSKLAFKLLRLLE